MAWYRIFRNIVFPVLLILTGCAGGDAGKYALVGVVQLDGKNVEQGQITFIPLAAGEVSATEIVGGQFSLPTTRGLEKGDYRVEILAFQKTGKKISGYTVGEMRDEIVQVLPDKYNRRSELKVSLELPQATPLRFDLKSDSKQQTAG